MTRARGSYSGLTAKQADLLSFLRHERDADRTPSFEEMREQMGLCSKSGIHRLIEGLVDRGYVDRLYHKARSLRVYDVSRLERSAAAEAAHRLDLTAVPLVTLLAEVARRASPEARV